MVHSPTGPRRARRRPRQVGSLAIGLALVLLLLDAPLSSSSGCQGREGFDFSSSRRGNEFDYGRVTGIDGDQIFRRDGNWWDHTPEHAASASCFLDWDSVSAQIRRARAMTSRKKGKRYANLGHSISINGKPEYSSVPPGVYLNRPTAVHETVSFHLSQDTAGHDTCVLPEASEADCFMIDQNGKCQQYQPAFEAKLRERKAECEQRKRQRTKLTGPGGSYLCDYVSSIQLMPTPVKNGETQQEIHQAVGLGRAEKSRQHEYCSCPEFTDCLLGLAASTRCRWSQFVNVNPAPRKQDMCMREVCKFWMDGAGELVSPAGISHFTDLKPEDCKRIWTEGSREEERGKWYFTVKSIAVTPGLLESTFQTEALSRDSDWPATTVPDSAPPPRASDWRCKWTQISFYAFDRDGECGKTSPFESLGKLRESKSAAGRDQLRSQRGTR